MKLFLGVAHGHTRSAVAIANGRGFVWRCLVMNRPNLVEGLWQGCRPAWLLIRDGRRVAVVADPWGGKTE